MKQLIIILILLVGLIYTRPAKAQANELAQLALNIEKLAQFKQILSDMKKGYDILSKGYGTIKNISEGNFNLHDEFLSGLLAVSPTVSSYHKVSRIVSNQILLVSEYKKAINRFKSSNLFSSTEIRYLESVYANLFKQSVRNLDELANVVTANKLRMSDDERLKAIDQIDDEMENQLGFLRQFNNSASVLSLQRQKAAREIQGTKKMYGVN